MWSAGKSNEMVIGKRWRHVHADAEGWPACGVSSEATGGVYARRAAWADGRGRRTSQSGRAWRSRAALRAETWELGWAVGALTHPLHLSQAAVQPQPRAHVSVGRQRAGVGGGQRGETRRDETRQDGCNLECHHVDGRQRNERLMRGEWLRASASNRKEASVLAGEAVIRLQRRIQGRRQRPPQLAERALADNGRLRGSCARYRYE
ncbi:hypothetical protein EJ04DRAFT_183807 [Polyplosphaeria fusca]|uniref:Uncharacterized protein n=1 Tax=Polyplosphaeria fusca TaxID=682080 RepID=A0A9P4R2R5_9PLEO|nr:hypothetical protein EJ04DRAFT_183807 [Polyplosphaeria fusca]